jgi:acyl carrier protein
VTPLKSELAAFIEKNLIGSERKITVDDQTPLIEEGIIDSMGLMQIVSFLEERAGVRVPDEEVGPDNFETLEAIDQMVKRLQDHQGRR